MNEEAAPTTMRLDQRVVSLVPEINRSQAARLIEQGAVTLNGVVATKSGAKTQPNDVIEVRYDHDEATRIPQIELPVIYEDDSVVVINKPVGLLSHSKGAFNPEATVATWLASRVKDMSGERAGIVHRLDRATSGIMICEKHPKHCRICKNSLHSDALRRRILR